MMLLFKAIERGLQSSSSFPTGPVGRGLIIHEDKIVDTHNFVFLLASIVLLLCIAKISDCEEHCSV